LKLDKHKKLKKLLSKSEKEAQLQKKLLLRQAKKKKKKRGHFYKKFKMDWPLGNIMIFYKGYS